MDEANPDPVAAPATADIPATDASGIPINPEVLAAEVLAKREEFYKRKERPYQKTRPIASDIDPDSCLRRQVMSITHWEEKRPIPGDRIPRMEVGDTLEEKVRALFRALGYETVEDQMPFELRGRNGAPVMGGKVDFKIRHRGMRIPVEVKSCATYVFDAIKTVEDFAAKWWTKRYPSQLTAYLLGFSAPFGFLVLCDLSGRVKIFVIYLDLSYAERILAFAEEIVARVAAYWTTKELPGYSKDATECVRCDFYKRACDPPLDEAGAAYVQDPELEQKLVRREELDPARREYATIDDDVKETLKRGPNLQLVGTTFMVSIAERGPKKTKYVDIRRVGDSSEQNA